SAGPPRGARRDDGGRAETDRGALPSARAIGRSAPRNIFHGGTRRRAAISRRRPATPARARAKTAALLVEPRLIPCYGVPDALQPMYSVCIGSRFTSSSVEETENANEAFDLVPARRVGSRVAVGALDGIAAAVETRRHAEVRGARSQRRQDRGDGDRSRDPRRRHGDGGRQAGDGI